MRVSVKGERKKIDEEHVAHLFQLIKNHKVKVSPIQIKFASHLKKIPLSHTLRLPLLILEFSVSRKTDFYFEKNICEIIDIFFCLIIVEFDPFRCSPNTRISFANLVKFQDEHGRAS